MKTSKERQRHERKMELISEALDTLANAKFMLYRASMNTLEDSEEFDALNNWATEVQELMRTIRNCY